MCLLFVFPSQVSFHVPRIRARTAAPASPTQGRNPHASEYNYIRTTRCELSSSHASCMCVCLCVLGEDEPALVYKEFSLVCVYVCVIFLLFFCEDCPIFVSFVWNCYDCCKKMWIYFDCRLSSVYLIQPPPPQVSRNFGPQLYTLSLPSPSIFPGWCRWLGWRVDGWGRGMGGVSVCVYPRVKHLSPPLYPLPLKPFTACFLSPVIVNTDFFSHGRK